MIQPQQTPQPLQSATPDPQAEARKKQQRGTGFTNINRVLGANQGAGQKIGQAIGSNLQGQAGQVKQDINKGTSEFQAGAQTNLATANNAIQQGKDLQKSSNDASDEAYAERLAKYNADQLASQGQALQQAAYSGPQGLSNAGQIQSRAATVGALGQLAGSSAGQAQLLRSQVAGRGGYSQGQNALDALLLGREGQGAVQQGRSAVTGLNQDANTAIQTAQQKAQGMASAVDKNKVATLQALQNQLSGTGDETSGNVKGFTQQAKEQAQDYQKNSDRLQQLLTGKDAEGKDITELSDADKALLQNMEKYGVENQEIYEKEGLNNPESINNAIGQIAGSLANDYGSSRYLGNQQGAAQNLARFLQQKDTAKNIGDTKFNEDVFQGDQKQLFGENQETFKKDKATQENLYGLSDYIKAGEEKTTADAARLKQILDTNIPMENLTGRDAEMLRKWRENKAYIDSGDRTFGTPGVYAPRLMDNVDVNSIHPLDMPNVWDQERGGFKSSASIRAAGDKALGNMTDVRQSVLNRYLKGQT